MFRTIVIFFGLVLMLGCGVAIAAWPKEGAAAQSSEQQMRAAYVRIRAGITPAADLPALGFDPAGAEKLSYLGVMEEFMPRDSFGFNSLDPSMQACFEARDRCTAYIFTLSRQSGPRVVLLIENGQVAYKAMTGLTSARLAPQRTGMD